MFEGKEQRLTPALDYPVPESKGVVGLRTVLRGGEELELGT